MMNSSNRRWPGLFWLAAVAGLVVVATYVLVLPDRANAQEVDCFANPTPSVCVGLDNTEIQSVEPLSNYPIYRNPMLSMTIKVKGGTPGGDSYLYLNHPFQLGEEGNVNVTQQHCPLIVLGLAGGAEDDYQPQLHVALNNESEATVRVFAYCRNINLLDASGKLLLPTSRAFPWISLEEGQVTSIEKVIVPADTAFTNPEQTLLGVLSSRLASGFCDSRLNAGTKITFDSFTAQLAVFAIFHKTTEGTDTTAAWQLFMDGGLTELTLRSNEIFGCLLAETDLATPQPTPTITPSPTITPTPNPGQIIGATRVPTFIDQPVIDNQVTGDSLADIFLRMAIVLGGGVGFAVLLRIPSIRGPLIIIALIALVIGLIYIAFVEGDSAGGAPDSDGLQSDMDEGTATLAAPDPTLAGSDPPASADGSGAPAVILTPIASPPDESHDANALLDPLTTPTQTETSTEE